MSLVTTNTKKWYYSLMIIYSEIAYVSYIILFEESLFKMVGTCWSKTQNVFVLNEFCDKITK